MQTLWSALTWSCFVTLRMVTESPVLGWVQQGALLHLAATGCCRSNCQKTLQVPVLCIVLLEVVCFCGPLATTIMLRCTPVVLSKLQSEHAYSMTASLRLHHQERRFL